MGFLVDTCIWVDVERGSIGAADVARFTGKEPVFLSPVTIAELSYGLEMATTDIIRHHRLSALERLKRKPVLVIDETTGDLFGRICVSLRRKGRHSAHRVQDIWLASQAIQHNHRFLTRNRKDFEDIPGLQTVVFE